MQTSLALHFHDLSEASRKPTSDAKSAEHHLVGQNISSNGYIAPDAAASSPVGTLEMTAGEQSKDLKNILEGDREPVSDFPVSVVTADEANTGHDSAEMTATVIEGEAEGQASATSPGAADPSTASPSTAEVKCLEGEASRDVVGQGLVVDDFKQQLSMNKAHLESFCLVWERKLEDELPEEAAKQIRYVVGIGRILTDRKGQLQQFSDLIGDCEYH
jgi:hypothetical protein